LQQSGMTFLPDPIVVMVMVMVMVYCSSLSPNDHLCKNTSNFV
jgi:hypothetical protein